MACSKSRTYKNKAGDDSSRLSISSVQLCLTLRNPMDCSTVGCLSITNSQGLLKLMSIESVMLSNHLILCRPFSPRLQSCRALYATTHKKTELSLSSCPFWPLAKSISFRRQSKSREAPLSSKCNGLKSAFHVAALVSGIKRGQCPNKTASECVFQCLSTSFFLLSHLIYVLTCF